MAHQLIIVAQQVVIQTLGVRVTTVHLVVRVVVMVVVIVMGSSFGNLRRICKLFHTIADDLRESKF